MSASMRGLPGRRRDHGRQHSQNLDDKPLQAEPEQTVSRAEASIGTSADAQLMAQGENLEEDV
jgi:hypothetical protein